MPKQYRVETYDAYDAPSERSHLVVGEFDSPEEALLAAKKVVVDFLKLNRPSMKSAQELSDQFSYFGEVPMILGDPQVDFNPYDFAEVEAIKILTANTSVFDNV